MSYLLAMKNFCFRAWHKKNITFIVTKRADYEIQNYFQKCVLAYYVANISPIREESWSK